MAQGASYVVQYRRKRADRTNYKSRLEMLKSRKQRLVVRSTNKRILVQMIKYAEEGDQVTVTSDSNELAKYGWKYSGNSLPAAYLVGFLCAKKGIVTGNTEAVLDIGLQASIKGSRLYAALKGAIDGGLQMPAGEKVFPDPKRLSGAHIAEYASKLGKAEYEKKFSGYIKAGADPKNISKSFEEVKKKIEESVHTKKTEESVHKTSKK
jgi:large subunit ribosomal protein L18